MPMPSPVRVCAFDVVLNTLPAPPVASTTALARKTWISPVACSGEEQVEDVELVEELHLLLDAVLVERLQNHVPGAVRGEAGPADGCLAVVAGVATEPALVDPSLGRPVERQSHPLQVQDRVDGLLAHHLGGVLVDQVVTALDGVEGVPLPVVLLDVRQRC